MMRTTFYILALLLATTHSYGQRYRLVADTSYNFFVFDNAYTVDKVVSYGYKQDRKAARHSVCKFGLPISEVEYSIESVERHGYLWARDIALDTISYDTLTYYDAISRNGNNMLSITNRYVKIYNAEGYVDSILCYKTDSLELMSIIVYRRDKVGRLLVKDEYEKSFYQPAADLIAPREGENDTVKHGTAMYLVLKPNYERQYEKIDIGYRLTRKDSFQYKNGILFKRIYYSRFMKFYHSNIPNYERNFFFIKDSLVDNVHSEFYYDNGKLIKEVRFSNDGAPNTFRRIGVKKYKYKNGVLQWYNTKALVSANTYKDVDSVYYLYQNGKVSRKVNIKLDYTDGIFYTITSYHRDKNGKDSIERQFNTIEAVLFEKYSLDDIMSSIYNQNDEGVFEKKYFQEEQTIYSYTPFGKISTKKVFGIYHNVQNKSWSTGKVTFVKEEIWSKRKHTYTYEEY